MLDLVSTAWLTLELRVPTKRITSDVKMVHFWDVAKNSHRKRTKATIVEELIIIIIIIIIILILINIYIAQIPFEYDQMRVTNKYDTNQT